MKTKLSNGWVNYKIITIFATWIGWSHDQPTSGKPTPLPLFDM